MSQNPTPPKIMIIDAKHDATEFQAISVEIFARNILTGRAEELTKSGFQDPAVIAFITPEKKVGFVVCDQTSPSWRNLARSHFPKGARQFGEIVYAPSGFYCADVQTDEQPWPSQNLAL